jgi:hypothetical protein
MNIFIYIYIHLSLYLQIEINNFFFYLKIKYMIHKLNNFTLFFFSSLLFFLFKSKLNKDFIFTAQFKRNIKLFFIFFFSLINQKKIKIKN